jgi:hypothetical protein
MISADGQNDDFFANIGRKNLGTPTTCDWIARAS